MPLPKVNHPTLPLLIPSLSRAFRFRPFTVKEEKILLMAKESTEPEVDQLRAIHQVVVNCSVDPELVVDSLATFDLEWLFLKLRAVSVGTVVPQAFIDKEERDAGGKVEPYEFNIDLDQVKAPAVPAGYQGFHVVNLENENRDSVMLRYPPASLYVDADFSKEKLGDAAVLHKSTVQIMSGAQTFRDFTREEVVEYYDSWQAKDMARVREFLDDTPTMLYEVKYVNKLGHDRTIRLTSLPDFFTF